MKPKVVVEKQSILGESPWWDAEYQRLHWVDILGCEVNIYDSTSAGSDVYPASRFVSCAIPSACGKILLCLQDGVYMLDISTGREELLCEVEAGLEQNRLNDGLCDSHGALWFGSMDQGGQRKRGSFYSLTPDGELKKHFNSIGISNGLCFSDDESMLFYIDTLAQCVYSCIVDTGERIIYDKKPLIDFTHEPGSPDGMAIDAEGLLWIAHYGGGRVSCWHPFYERKLAEVLLPATNVTSCCFGGADLKTLFITTARDGLDEKQLEREPLAGSLFAVRTNTVGTPLHRFGL